MGFIDIRSEPGLSVDHDLLTPDENFSFILLPTFVLGVELEGSFSVKSLC